MSEILLSESEKPQEEEELKYKATDADEERFFLMYHMNIQPSEAEALGEDYRKWLIARFVGQKTAEREMMQQARMMQQLGPQILKG